MTPVLELTLMVSSLSQEWNTPKRIGGGFIWKKCLCFKEILTSQRWNCSFEIFFPLGILKKRSVFSSKWQFWRLPLGIKFFINFFSRLRISLGLLQYFVLSSVYNSEIVWFCILSFNYIEISFGAFSTLKLQYNICTTFCTFCMFIFQIVYLVNFQSLV